MSQKRITAPELANMLAIQSGESVDVCRSYIRTLFRIVPEALEQGEQTVKIKGFGSFRLVDVAQRMSVNVSSGEDMEIPPHRKVVFTPSKELASLVNAPFDMFEAVELSDSISEDDLFDEESEVTVPAPEASDDETDETATAEPPVSQETLTEIESSPSEDYIIEEQSIEETSTETDSDQNPDVNETPIESPTEPEPEPTENEPEEANHIQEEAITGYATPHLPTPEQIRHERGYRFMWGFFTGFACALATIGIGIAIFYFLGIRDMSALTSGTQEEQSEAVQLTDVEKESTSAVADTVRTNTNAPLADTDPEESETVQPDNTVAETQVATQPSDAKVYDTITRTRYLTTMAKDHYGNYNLWPIIYEENKSILGHPDRIRPGTQVVIPPLEKYGVNPNSEEDIRKAKRKGVEIYSRYK